MRESFDSRLDEMLGQALALTDATDDALAELRLWLGRLQATGDAWAEEVSEYALLRGLRRMLGEHRPSVQTAS